MIISLRDPGLATGEVEGENFFGDPVDSIHSDRWEISEQSRTKQATYIQRRIHKII